MMGRRQAVKFALSAGMGAGLLGTTELGRAAQSGATPIANSPAAASGPQTLSIRVGDIDIAYRVLGQGAPLVMIMGSVSTMDLWDPTLLAELAAHYLVITFDNRGIGGTFGGGAYPFQQLADDTAGLIKALGLNQANVFGWLMGGSVALDLSLRHPELVAKAVLNAVDCGGSQAIPPSPAVIAQLTDTSGTPQQQGQRRLELLFPDTWLGQNFPYVARVFFRPSGAVSPEAIGFQTKAIASWAGVFAKLPQVKAPTLILQGMEDVLTPPKNAQILGDAVPGSWLIRLAGGGHGVQYQQRKLLAGLVQEFLMT